MLSNKAKREIRFIRTHTQQCQNIFGALPGKGFPTFTNTICYRIAL